MLNKEAAFSRIDNMPIDELMSKIRNALDDSQINYVEGQGTIVWDGLPQAFSDTSACMNMVVPQRRVRVRKYRYSSCDSQNAKKAAPEGSADKQYLVVVA